MRPRVASRSTTTEPHFAAVVLPQQPARCDALAVRSLLLILLLLPLIACHRNVAVGTQPRPVYAVLVTNQTGQEMIVSYDAGSGPHVLGAVPDRSTQRFVIATVSSTVVEISGRSATGARLTGPYRIDLGDGTIHRVTLQ